MTMISLLFFPKLLIAGGSSFLGTLQIPPAEELLNHTLAGKSIPAAQIVCRDRWGTPMLPDGSAGYSLIAPIKKDLIAQSLWIPPVSGSRPTPTPALAAPTPKPTVPAPTLEAQPTSLTSPTGSSGSASPFLSPTSTTAPTTLPAK